MRTHSPRNNLLENLGREIVQRTVPSKSRVCAHAGRELAPVLDLSLGVGYEPLTPGDVVVIRVVPYCGTAVLGVEGEGLLGKGQHVIGILSGHGIIARLLSSHTPALATRRDDLTGTCDQKTPGVHGNRGDKDDRFDGPDDRIHRGDERHLSMRGVRSAYILRVSCCSGALNRARYFRCAISGARARRPIYTERNLCVHTQMRADACTQTEPAEPETTNAWPEPKKRKEREDPGAMQALRAEVGRYYAWLRELRRKGQWDPETDVAPCPILTAHHWNQSAI